MAPLKPADFVQRRLKLGSWEEKEKLLADAIETENLYRGLFARHRESWEIPEVDDPHLGLIDVYKNSEALRCLPRYTEDSVPRIFDLGSQRKPEGFLSVAPSLGDFASSWDCFTESQLRFLNWNNVFAAGGAVSGCLQALPEKVQSSNWAEGRSKRRQYFHDEAFPGSDVDLFLYGLGEKEAEAKLVEIFEAVQAANPYPVVSFRSAYAVTLVSQYPFRHIQIVLRLYNSPAEVLMGFDVDSCACGYDGQNVFVCQRTAIAFAAQANTVDMSRRSPSYEMRLSKYAERGFEVLVPSLERDRVDPFIYEKRFDQVQGLARLLLLERLRTPEARFQYRMEQRLKKVTMKHQQYRIRSQLQKILRDKHELASHEAQEVHAQGAELSDYSTVFLPWGPKWTASKIRSVMAKKDRVLNTVEFKPGGRVVKCTRKYRLHLCAAGTMEEVIQDPFPHDPPIPEDVSKDSLAQCVRGRVAWLVDNPGRQQIGSFNPITDGNWIEGAHLSTHLEEAIARCAANDADGLRGLLSQDEDASAMLSARDFLGRSPLHVATLANATAAAKELLQSSAAGAPLLEARLADGRFALHLAAMHGFEEIVELILEKRLELAKQSAGDGVPKPEEIFDIDAADWEVKLSPLQYAVLFGHESVLERLLKAGADAKKPAVHKDAQANMYGAPVSLSHSTLSLCAKFAGDSRKLEEAARMAKTLMAAGASTSQVSTSFRTVYHDLAEDERKADVLELLLSLDTAKKQVLDVLDSSGKSALALATSARNAKAVRHLLQHGAQVQFSDEEYAARKRRADTSSNSGSSFGMFGGFGNPTAERNDALNSAPILLAAENFCIDCLNAFIEHCPDLLQTTMTLKGQQPQSLLDICEQKKVSQASQGDDSAKQQKKRLEAAEKARDKQPEGSYTRMLWSREVWRQKYMQQQGRPHRAFFGPSGNAAADELKSRTEAFIQLLKDKGVQRLSSGDETQTKAAQGMFCPIGMYQQPPGESDPLQEYAEVPAQQIAHAHLFNHRILPKLPKGEQGLAHGLLMAAYEEDGSALAAAARKIPVATMNAAGATPLWLAVLRGNVTQVEMLWQIAKEQYVKEPQAAPGDSTDMAGQLRFMNNLDLAAGITPQATGPGSTPEEIRKKLADFGEKVLEGGASRSQDAVTSKVSPVQLLLKPADVPERMLKVQAGFLERLRELSKQKLDYNPMMARAMGGSFGDESGDEEEQHEPLEDYVNVSPIEVALLQGDFPMLTYLLRLASEEAGSGEGQGAQEEEQKEPMAEVDEDGDEDEHEDVVEVAQAAGDTEVWKGKDLLLQLLKKPNQSLGGADPLRLAILLDQPKAFEELAAVAEELILPAPQVEAWRKELEPQELTDKRSATRHMAMHTGYPFVRPVGAALQFGAKEATRRFARGLDPSLLRFLQQESRLRKCQFALPFVAARQWLHSQVAKGQITIEDINRRLFGLESTDATGRTAVFYADANGVKELAAFGPNLDHCSGQSGLPGEGRSDHPGATPFMMASYRGDLELMSALLDAGCSATSTGGGGWNALHCAVVGVKQEVDDNQVTKSEDTEKSLKAVRFLLSRPEAPELLFAEGCEHTPLMLAAQRGHALTRLLAEATLAAGARGEEALARRDRSFRTAMHLGTTPLQLDAEALKVLIETGADKKLGDKATEALSASVEDGSGMTPLQLVMEKVAQIWSQSHALHHPHGMALHFPAKSPKKAMLPSASRERQSLDLLFSSAAGRPRTMASFSQVQETVKIATDARRKPGERMSVFAPDADSGGVPVDLDVLCRMEDALNLPQMNVGWF